MDMDNFWNLRSGQGRNGCCGVDRETSGPSSQVGGTNHAGSFQSNIRAVYKGPPMDSLPPAVTQHLSGQISWLQPVRPIGKPSVCNDLQRCRHTGAGAVDDQLHEPVDGAIKQQSEGSR